MAKKIIKEEIVEEIKIDGVKDSPVKSEKERLLELYETLKALNVRSISDLENLIARS